MARCKRNEVPKEYRRNLKKEAIELIQAAALCAVVVVIFMLMIYFFN